MLLENRFFKMYVVGMYVHVHTHACLSRVVHEKGNE